MTAKIRPYPAHKDSGVPWLSEVPAHWQVLRTKRLAKLNPSKAEIGAGTSGSTPVTFLPMELVSADGRVDASDIRPLASVSSGFTYMRRDDVIIAKITPCFENGKGACLDALPTEIGFGSTEFHVLRAHPAVSPRFLYRILMTAHFREMGTEAMRGAAGQQRVPAAFVADFVVGLPPLPEQRAIVRYLDYVDRRIRRYIRAKQKLIKLLEEQKQAIIAQAVTRGLDSNVRLKPSGVEWLGDVPEHWEILRSKRAFTPRTELARPDDVQLSATQAYGVIAQEEYERRVGRRIVKILRHLEKRRHVEVDDFVISMRSFQGGLERAWAAGCIRSSYVVLRSGIELDVGYFAYLFKSKGYIGALQSTANFIRDGQDLNYANFCAVDLPFPPLAEQRRIADYLNASLTGMDREMQQAKQGISLLQEYRTRLIADVVTGKLDVREAAARLPDEPEEAEIAEEDEEAIDDGYAAGDDEELADDDEAV